MRETAGKITGNPVAIRSAILSYETYVKGIDPRIDKEQLWVEALLALNEAMRRFDPSRAQVQTWVAIWVRNQVNRAAMQQLRRVQHEVPLEYAAESAAPERPDCDRLWIILDAMHRHDRIVLIAWLNYDLDDKRLAAKTGTTVPKAKSRILGALGAARAAAKSLWRHS